MSMPSATYPAGLGASEGLEDIRDSVRGFLTGVESRLALPPSPEAPPLVPAVPPTSSGSGWFGGFTGSSRPTAALQTSPSVGAPTRAGTHTAETSPETAWCVGAARENLVVPNQSWGSLDAEGQQLWTAKGCDQRFRAAAEFAQTRPSQSRPSRQRDGAASGQQLVVRSAHRGDRERDAAERDQASFGAAAGSFASTGLAAGGAHRAGAPPGDGPSGAPSEGEVWCREAMWKFDVRPGSTWGKMGAEGQAKWRTQNCDGLIVTAKAAFVDNTKLPNCAADPRHQTSVLESEVGIKRQLPLVAVCCGTTTRKVTGPQLSKLALFRYLLPSMAHTMECGLRYVAVVGYDKGDPFYDSLHGQLEVEEWFAKHLQQPLAQRGVVLELSMVQVDNKLKKPGPVFNKVCAHAHSVLGAAYIYRVNDDTEMDTPWAHAMIRELASLDPPNVGAVGPQCKQGNVKILTHDFTHRTHMEIFKGRYYPDELVDWWMDDWISRVYGSRRTRQGTSVAVVHHTGAHGQRYAVDKGNKRHLDRTLKEGKASIVTYLKKSGATDAAVQSLVGDRFTGFPFKKF